MTLAPIEHTNPAPTPTRLGQATAVEQSRAVAEVQAAVLVAQQCRRNLGEARTLMEQACRHLPFAERAFFRFPRGGEIISGATVHLARELAGAWGNVQYGIDELRRDDAAGESEVRAWAWDLQTNTRSSMTFVVPHLRDTKRGPVKLTDARDIYEAIANQGARRLREAIFAVLPVWFTDEAQDICRQTIERGDGKPLPERIDQCAALFDSLGVTVERLERKLGRKRDRWTSPDLAQLSIAYKSITRGEITVEDEFPAARVTADELGAPPAAAPAPAASPATAPASADEPPAGDTAARIAELEQQQAAEPVGPAAAARRRVADR